MSGFNYFDESLIRKTLGEITDEYGCEYTIMFDINDKPNVLNVRFTDLKTDAHLRIGFDMGRIATAYEPVLAFVAEVKNVLHEWEKKKENRNKKYRDILVNQIKSVGQQLVDRAEEMVSEKLAYVTDFSININIPQSVDEPVAISWRTETIDTNQLK